MVPSDIAWSRILAPLVTGEAAYQPPDSLPHRDLIPEELHEAAVLVPLLPSRAGIEVILTRRNRRLRRHAGQISFPGGTLEPGDDSRLDAALRESEEEIGLDRGAVDPLGCLEPIVTITGYQVFPFVARIRTGAPLTPDRREVAEIFTVPLAFLLDPANCQVERAWFRGREREYLVFPYGERKIWGATATMLRDLAERIRRG